MKTVTLKFPIQGDMVQSGISIQAHDFLTDAILNEDLNISNEDLIMLEMGTPEYLESHMDDEAGMFFIYGIELSGEDHTIDTIEQWQDQFKQQLQ